MSDAPQRRRRRWIAVAVGTATVVVVGGLVVRTLVLRDRARSVSTADALDRYRTEISAAATNVATSTTVGDVTSVVAVSVETSVSSTTSSLAPATVRTLAEPGVYRYRTSGAEGIDVLGGTDHPYPDATTITVVPDGCGASFRWDALQERWDQWHLCLTPAGIELQTDGIQYHEFFGQGEREAVVCDAGVLLVPNAPEPGDSVQQSCMLDTDPWLPLWEVLETGRRTVEGRDLHVRHVRMTIDDNDDYWEHLVVDWYLADNGLPIEVVETKTSRSPSAVGPVEYHEQYHLELISLTPLR